MEEIIKHINDTNASYRALNAGDAKNTDLFLDNEHYEMFKDAGEQIIVRFSKENLQKAILFIASILPRKYDNSSIHKTIPFSEVFVLDQLAFLDCFFTQDDIQVETRTQVWNARKDVPQKNGEIDRRFYFNGLLEDVSYKSHTGEIKNAKFTIRNYLAGGYSDLHIKKANDGVFDVWITNVLEPYNDRKEEGREQIDVSRRSLHQIFYGAPGTGKSKTIKNNTEQAEKEGRVFRTTFHPDSDYSTFVGCYKPTKIKSFKQPKMDMSLDDLAKALGSYYKNEELGKIGGLQQFCLEYYPYIDGEYMSVNVTKLIELAGVPKDYNVEVNKYIKFIHLLPHHDPDKITYEFTPQAFTTAYVKAWNTEEDVYLIIEEINRGNCAQIFGDLFQLLDRKDGVSEYPIDADTDLANYISKKLEKSSRTDFPDGVKEGKKLLLPSNLYIWATMNTSDQSLFPIDSAFKRRWDWKYIKITEGKDKDTKKPLGWKILVDDIQDNRVRAYDWWRFLQRMNDIIYTATESADKQMGYFFAKATEHLEWTKVGEIGKDGKLIEKDPVTMQVDYVTADTFVNKVLFYLWTDIMKDNEYAEIVDLMKKDGKQMKFPDFFDEEGESINSDALRTFLDNVMKEEEVLCEVMEKMIKEDRLKANDAGVSAADEETDDGLSEQDLKRNGGKSNFTRVTFSDGTVIDEGDRFATYVAALKKFGIEKSAEIGETSKLHRHNLPLICKNAQQTPPPPYSYVMVDGVYIMKGTNSMHRMLIKIGKELNVSFRLD